MKFTLNSLYMFSQCGQSSQGIWVHKAYEVKK